jgi:GNAT superfamily N-acetyltransferase
MSLEFRQARLGDLSQIVRMLADDFLGAARERLEDPLAEGYIKAFHEIEADPNNELIVAVLLDEPAEEPTAIQSVVGMMQITFTPSISFQGGKRATVESVRVDRKYRSQGIGREMMLWAIDRAKREGCISMQLTTNIERTDAHRFYENLGFAKSHLGMKLTLK